VDSLGKLNLLSEIENRADVMFDENSLFNLQTLGELAGALAQVMDQS